MQALSRLFGRDKNEHSLLETSAKSNKKGKKPLVDLTVLEKIQVSISPLVKESFVVVKLSPLNKDTIQAKKVTIEGANKVTIEGGSYGIKFPVNGESQPTTATLAIKKVITILHKNLTIQEENLETGQVGTGLDVSMAKAQKFDVVIRIIFAYKPVVISPLDNASQARARIYAKEIEGAILNLELKNEFREDFKALIVKLNKMFEKQVKKAEK